MPVTKGKYKCLLCEDEFNADSSTFSKCKCGETEIQPTQFGYSYRNGNRVETLEQKTHHLETEFVKFPDEIQAIYNEIRSIKDKNGYKYYLYEMTDSGENGEKYLHQINLEYSERVDKYSSEYNGITLNISLRKNEYKGDAMTKVRLEKFLEIMKRIEDGSFSLSERSKMIDFVDKEDIYYRSEPTGETNYTFYF